MPSAAACRLFVRRPPGLRSSEPLPQIDPDPPCGRLRRSAGAAGPGPVAAAPPSFPPPGPAPLRHDALLSGGHAAPPKYARRIAAPPPPRRRSGQNGPERIHLGTGAPPTAPTSPDLRGGIPHSHGPVPDVGPLTRSATAD